jgi:hypothetical protein
MQRENGFLACEIPMNETLTTGDSGSRFFIIFPLEMIGFDDKFK